MSRYAKDFLHKGEWHMVRIFLSKLLGELRWTQADLARKAGIRPTTINLIYHELVDRVNLEHLDLICEALDCKLSDLLVYVPNSEPKCPNTRSGHTVQDS